MVVVVVVEEEEEEYEHDVPNIYITITFVLHNDGPIPLSALTPWRCYYSSFHELKGLSFLLSCSKALLDKKGILQVSKSSHIQLYPNNEYIQSYPKF